MEKELAILIDGCLQNNRKAQEQLYRQLYGFAMSVALKYSRDDMDAGDILSIVFVKLFKSLQSFDSAKGNFFGWFKKIIVNEAIDHIKQRGKFSSVELTEAYEPQIESAAVEAVNEQEILHMIQQLPPATHAVFVLYVIEGYAHKEIAKQLAISEGTSKWHLSEARKILQQKIKTHTTG